MQIFKAWKPTGDIHMNSIKYKNSFGDLIGTSSKCNKF